MIKEINIKLPKPMSKTAYWQMKAKHGPELKPLNKPCHDCAVTTGFYQPFTDELKDQPTHIQHAVSKRWTCHNHTNNACKGNWNQIMLSKQHRLPGNKTIIQEDSPN